MDLKSLLKKSPLEMSDEELRENVRQLQNVRRIPDLSAAVHGKKKKATAKKTAKKETDTLHLEEALKAFAAKKENTVDKTDTENSTTNR